MNFRIALALGAVLLGDLAEVRSQPIILSPEEGVKQARTMVGDMLAVKPDRDSTNFAVLKIRRKDGKRLEIPVKIQIVVTPTNWLTVYSTTTNSIGRAQMFSVEHREASRNCYKMESASLSGNDWSGVTNWTLADLKPVIGGETLPFMESDFWLIDLGLEFLHWPDQRVLRKELYSGQSCAVLESSNPHPVPGGYSRVLTWIDQDTGAIIKAEGYATGKKPLKEFSARSVKKVHGQWQPKEIEMENRQTGSRTRIEFDYRD